jgi:hypothetical protein
VNAANDGRLAKPLGFCWVSLSIKLFSGEIERRGWLLCDIILFIEAILSQFELSYQCL